MQIEILLNLVYHSSTVSGETMVGRRKKEETRNYLSISAKYQIPIKSEVNTLQTAFYSASSPLYINTACLSRHEWNIVEKHIENCGITVLAADAYVVKVR